MRFQSDLWMNIWISDWKKRVVWLLPQGISEAQLFCLYAFPKHNCDDENISSMKFWGQNNLILVTVVQKEKNSLNQSNIDWYQVRHPEKEIINHLQCNVRMTGYTLHSVKTSQPQEESTNGYSKPKPCPLWLGCRKGGESCYTRAKCPSQRDWGVDEWPSIM